MRWLRLLLGATAPAASATLVAFFGGSALGAAWAARRSPRWSSPLAIYGRFELAGAGAAAAVPPLLGAGGRPGAPPFARPAAGPRGPDPPPLPPPPRRAPPAGVCLC